MSRFQYIAKSYSDGSEHRGTIEAADRNSAIAAIRANGLMPTALGQVLDDKIDRQTPTKRSGSFTIKKLLKAIAKTIDDIANKF